MPEEQNTITIRDAHIIYRNFRGEEGQYNKAGDRNFTVVLPLDFADQLAADNWNVKYREPYEEGDDRSATLQVSVGFKVMPPRITMITTANRTHLDEELVDSLDWADIRKADIVIRPYDWDVAGKTGRKAYLKTMFVEIDEDELEREYAEKGII